MLETEKMGNGDDFSEFDKRQIGMGRLGQRLFQTTAPVGCSGSAVVSV